MFAEWPTGSIAVSLPEPDRARQACGSVQGRPGDAGFWTSSGELKGYEFECG